MSSWEAFLTGLIQGLTEFFPVSSSAHLKLFKLMIGAETSESHVIFDLMCHLGTLCALLYFLRRDLIDLFRFERKKIALLFLATLPLVPLYFLLKPVRDFASQPQYLGFCLCVTGLILYLGDKVRLRQLESSPRISDALWIGTMQAAALIPGISRSGSTIACARVLGWGPRDAVRFSFLLAIPTIIGGNSLELLRLVLKDEIGSVSFSSCLIAFASALIVGLLVIRTAFRWLERGNLKPFAIYCASIGLFAIIYLNI